jgi:hypothetical protein
VRPFPITILSICLPLAMAALAADDTPAGTKADLRLASAPTVRADKLAAVRDAGVELFRATYIYSVIGRMGDPGVDACYRGLADKGRLRITFDPPLPFKLNGEDRAVTEVVIGVTDMPGGPYKPYAMYAIDADRQLANCGGLFQNAEADKLADAIAAAVPPRPAATQEAATRPATTLFPDEEERTIERAGAEMKRAARAMYDELAKAPPGPDRPSPELLYQWSKRLRFTVDLLTEHGHLDRMRQRLKEEEALHARGAAPLTNVLAYRYFVAEAELEHTTRSQHMRAAQEMLREAREMQRDAAAPKPPAELPPASQP